MYEDPSPVPSPTPLPAPVDPPLRLLFAGPKDLRRAEILKELSRRAKREALEVTDGTEPDYRVSITDESGKDGRLGHSYLGTNLAVVHRDNLRRLPGYKDTYEDRATAALIWHELLHHQRKSQDHDREGLMSAKPSLNSLLLVDDEG